MKVKKTIKQQVQEEMPEFADSCNSLSADELNGRLAECAKAAENVQEAQENDEELAQAKESAKQMGAGYRDAKKAVRLKSRYLIAVLKDRGVI